MVKSVPAIISGGRMRDLKVGDGVVLWRFPDNIMGFVFAANTEVRGFRRKLLAKIRSSSHELWGPAYAEIPVGACLRLIDEGFQVQFVRIKADEGSYRDALQLPNGQVLSLQKFDVGLRARVLSLKSLPALSEVSATLDYSGVITPS